MQVRLTACAAELHLYVGAGFSRPVSGPDPELRDAHRMSTPSKPAIGARLRAHRERRGITLAALAESIKVKQTLLENLERGDLSRWPPGIYGRALVREYAKAIGLPPNETLEELGELFPEEERWQRAERLPRGVAAHGSPAHLRLTLAGPSTATSSLLRLRLRAALIEAAAIVASGVALSHASGLEFWTATAVLALVWYPVAAMVCGHEVLYRKLRLPRLGTWRPSRTSTSPIASARPTEMSTVTIAAPLDAVADAPLIIDSNVHASPSASVH